MSRPLRGTVGVRTTATGKAGGRTGMGVGRTRSRERERKRERKDKVRQEEYHRWMKLREPLTWRMAGPAVGDGRSGGMRVVQRRSKGGKEKH
jgi:hypothetical protein